MREISILHKAYVRDCLAFTWYIKIEENPIISRGFGRNLHFLCYWLPNRKKGKIGQIRSTGAQFPAEPPSAAQILVLIINVYHDE